MESREKQTGAETEQGTGREQQKKSRDGAGESKGEHRRNKKDDKTSSRRAKVAGLLSAKCHGAL
jgi:hypothetical protein